jgi:hypothetical protein
VSAHVAKLGGIPARVTAARWSTQGHTMGLDRGGGRMSYVSDDATAIATTKAPSINASHPARCFRLTTAPQTQAKSSVWIRVDDTPNVTIVSCTESVILGGPHKKYSRGTGLDDALSRYIVRS